MWHAQFGQRGSGLLFETTAEIVICGELLQQGERMLARKRRIGHGGFLMDGLADSYASVLPAAVFVPLKLAQSPIFRIVGLISSAYRAANAIRARRWYIGLCPD